MSFLFTFLSFLPPLTMGFLIVSVFWHKDGSLFSDLPLKCCLSVGFGFGTSSCLVFIWMMIVGQLTRGVLVCESVLVVGICVLFICRKRASLSTAADQPESVCIPSLEKSISFALSRLPGRALSRRSLLVLVAARPTRAV